VTTTVPRRRAGRRALALATMGRPLAAAELDPHCDGRLEDDAPGGSCARPMRTKSWTAPEPSVGCPSAGHQPANRVVSTAISALLQGSMWAVSPQTVPPVARRR
jgi:hypothetical protein